jgi:hypothetical protein
VRALVEQLARETPAGDTGASRVSCSVWATGRGRGRSAGFWPPLDWGQLRGGRRRRGASSWPPRERASLPVTSCMSIPCCYGACMCCA